MTALDNTSEIYAEKVTKVFFDLFGKDNVTHSIYGFYKIWLKTHKDLIEKLTSPKSNISSNYNNDIITIIKYRERSISAIMQGINKEITELGVKNVLLKKISSFLAEHDKIYLEILNTELKNTKNEVIKDNSQQKVIGAYSNTARQMGDYRL